MTKMFLCGFFIAGFAMGCSRSTAPGDSTTQAEPATAAPADTRQGVIPQGQLDAMAKAAATSSMLEQAEQERRKQMEAQGL